VLVGGATRLTDSGLSIVEWKPIHGVIPPLTEAQWQEELEKYRQIPEYQLINRGMSLDEFKAIYWWEWAHRILGRLIGLAALVPLLVFWWRGALSRDLKVRGAAVVGLVAAQGALGWYMVSSGLTERTDVSQYRLAAHLTLAFFIFAFTVWTAWRVDRPVNGPWSRANIWALALVGLVLLQVAFGGFVAGIDAGMGFNTWPLMEGRLIPEGLFYASPAWINFFENALTVQFTHRMLAYALFVAVLVNWWMARDRAGERDPAFWLVAAVLAQMAIGIWTLLAQVPVWLGLLHQGGAVIVLLAALANLYASRAAGARKTPVLPGGRAVQPIA
jgi:cytochrome c oxidase assembly protein subunit 15